MTPRQHSAVALAVAAAAMAGDQDGLRLLLADLGAADLRGVVEQQAGVFVLCLRLMADRDGVAPTVALAMLRREIARQVEHEPPR